MSIFNMVGCGGSSLNYEVVDGTSAPSSPSENTIWIDTSTTITSHIFSAAEPEKPDADMVWISVGTSSAVAFSVTEENPIIVYPLSAKQYISGAWVAKTAKSYQGGEWVDWVAEGVLYDKGNQCEHVTGGWYTPVADTGNVVYNSDSIFIEQTTDKNAYTQVSTRNKINLKGYSTLKINVTSYNRNANSKPGLTVSSGVGNNIVRLATVFVEGTGVTSLDISAVTQEECYVVVYAYYGTNWQMTFDKVWLE